MSETQLILSSEETALILTRRELIEKRKASDVGQPTNPAQKASSEAPRPKKQPSQNRPAGWDNHCDPCRIHKGRLTEGHPMHWFEEKVFRKIPNMGHQVEHKKISELLGMPVQTNSRDRVYHALCHLDVLWAEDKLPVAYKKRYEDYKVEHKIGADNIHPDHKMDGVQYPIPNNIRPWNIGDHNGYDPNEEFSI